MAIKIVGAKENNLKNIDIEIPSKQIIVFTGVSGSGKSSLAFDTIYKEGQRRYLETFSSYARNFIGNFDRPNVEHISGLSPVISIEQKTISKNPRSTVGTTTEIYDFIRLLFAKIGKPISYLSQKPMIKQDLKSIFNSVIDNNQNDEVLILSPKVISRKGHYSELFTKLSKRGFAKVRVNGDIIKITPKLRLDRYKTHDIDVLIDKLIINKKTANRLLNSIKIALDEGDGSLLLHNISKDKKTYYSKHLTCPDFGISYPNPEPNSFSFNSPKGYCQNCKGLGEIEEIDINLIIPNKNINIQNGGILPIGEYKNNWIFSQLEVIGKKYNFDLKTPIKEISTTAMNVILFGKKESFKIKNSKIGISKKYEIDFEGIISFIDFQYKNANSNRITKWAKKFYKKRNCDSCKGQKLKKESLHFFIQKKNIEELSNLNILELKKWCNELIEKENGKNYVIAKEIIKEVITRLNFLINIGLDYLTISRKTKTLSGGESQRIRIASQIGSELSNVLYILDEPSIGLHASDNDLLIKSLKKLKEIGNTIIIVEHDKAIIEASDFVVDIGPNAGEKGGYIVYKGKQKDLIKTDSWTARQFIIDSKKLLNRIERPESGKFIIIKNARGNNLKNISISIPIGKLTVVTGVSGSGKSTLINGTLYPAIYNKINGKNIDFYEYKSISGCEHIDKIINIDQSPIGRTPRSNPATYTDFYTDIRKLFANQKESKIRGYNIGRFSFNVSKGNCTECDGNGQITIQMKLLPDIEVPCKKCGGKRFDDETLEIEYNNKNIFQVLEMSIDEAVDFFDKIPKIKNKLKSLQLVGMGYIKIGQSSTKLSGGEAQRVKLGAELSKKDTGKTFYILDEPTTGLHFKDIKILMKAINLLVDKGNTVVIIEHNTDVIIEADNIIDLGPGGGEKGGEIVYCGNVKNILNNKRSMTGVFLKKEIT